MAEKSVAFSEKFRKYLKGAGQVLSRGVLVNMPFTESIHDYEGNSWAASLIDSSVI